MTSLPPLVQANQALESVRDQAAAQRRGEARHLENRGLRDTLEFSALMARQQLRPHEAQGNASRPAGDSDTAEETDALAQAQAATEARTHPDATAAMTLAATTPPAATGARDAAATLAPDAAGHGDANDPDGLRNTMLFLAQTQRPAAAGGAQARTASMSGPAPAERHTDATWPETGPEETQDSLRASFLTNGLAPSARAQVGRSRSGASMVTAGREPRAIAGKTAAEPALPSRPGLRHAGAATGARLAPAAEAGSADAAQARLVADTFSTGIAAETRGTEEASPGLSMQVAPAPTGLPAASPTGGLLHGAPGTAPAPHAGALPQHLDSPAWQSALSQQFLRLGQFAAGQQSVVQQMDLSLNPASLGPLRIMMSVQDGVAHAWINTAHSHVRQSIESALPQLQDALADTGLTLADTQVSDQPGAGHEQAQAFFQAALRQARSGPAANITDSGAASLASAGRAPARVLRPDALLDTFA